MFKMARKSAILFVGLSLLLGLSACSETDENVSHVSNASNTVNNQTFQKTGTIKGTIFDATTGERIGGADLGLTLVQGASHRAPNVLISNLNSRFVGDFAFKGVPVELDNGNIVHRIVVIKPGYQRFEGSVTLKDSGLQTLPGTTDGTFDFTGNIYLFPLGGSAPDLKVNVETFLSHEPVFGATVVLQQNAAVNAPTAETFDRILPAPGFLPTLTGTTIDDGSAPITVPVTPGNAIATFPGSELVLGGSYTATVLPLKREGILLTPRAVNAGIVVGRAVMPITISMENLEPGGLNDGLHVLFASNQQPGDISPNGVLTLVFNRPVAVVADFVGESPFIATLIKPDTAVLNGSNALAIPLIPNTAASVTAVLSLDRLTLTLTPNFLVDPVPFPGGDTELDLVFSGGLVTLFGDEGARGNAVFGEAAVNGAGDAILFAPGDLTGINGLALSGVVHVTGP